MAQWIVLKRPKRHLASVLGTFTVIISAASAAAAVRAAVTLPNFAATDERDWKKPYALPLEESKVYFL